MLAEASVECSTRIRRSVYLFAAFGGSSNKDDDNYYGANFRARLEARSSYEVVSKTRIRCRKDGKFRCNLS